jgi:hypothetical protein
MNDDYRDPLGSRVARCEIKAEWNVNSLRPYEKDWEVYEPKIAGVKNRSIFSACKNHHHLKGSW